MDPRDTWAFAVGSLTKRLKAAGIDAGYTNTVDQRAWKTIWGCVDEYERRHNSEHPVRVWERGDVTAELAS
jgi:hypothetical protein